MSAQGLQRSAAGKILEAFPKLRALVVGDICLDRWCRYDPALADISRETGIPRIAVVSTEITPGAGGTVANNLIALGAGKVAVLGLAGRDGFGYELEGALAARGISTELLVRGDVPTFTYTKLIHCRTGEEDLPRVDWINAQAVPENLERELVARLERAAPDYDVVFISDQAETNQGGVVTAAMRNALARLGASQPHTVFWVDSRLRAAEFRRVIVKVNRAEAEAASLRALGRVDFPALREIVEAPLLAITSAGEGALVVGPSGELRAPTRAIEKPVDICGAGDSFSAGAALALKATGDPLAAAHFGNLVASITIMKKGTGTASPSEVLAKAAEG
ncbi:MAG: PfkB family carbohydrate kinase [Bryobacteraceae bacterium]|jgi:rfaE bifunctional protein kinase chain/domain